MPLADVPDLKPYRTADGSFTLRSERCMEGYRSVHGAILESAHVFINAGLLPIAEKAGDRRIDLLEVGLGTGLNLLLTWVRCLEGKCAVNYTALEPHPLSAARCEELGHAEELAWPGAKGTFLKMMNATAGEVLDEGALRFQLRKIPVQELLDENAFDLIYFDAFGPRTQPEMWTLQVMEIMFRSLRPGGSLVTYCAKGSVRRAMQSAGLHVERLPGPPGKRHMLRGIKTSTAN